MAAIILAVALHGGARPIACGRGRDAGDPADAGTPREIRAESS
jgi:hypothetical protein